MHELTQHPNIDDVTFMFINKPHAGIEFVDMHELTDSISLLFMVYPDIIECGGIFKPRALLVRTHTAGQSFVLRICFALQ